MTTWDMTTARIPITFSITNVLVSTPMLHPDKKISIINQYIWPQLVYGFQACPLTKLQLGFLNDVDLIVRNTLKNILGLPDDTPTSMLYSSNKNRELNLFRAKWEAFIQTFSICDKLKIINNEHLHHFPDFSNEQEKFLEKLKTSKETKENIKTGANYLQREKEFNYFLKRPMPTLGLKTESDYPLVNG